MVAALSVVAFAACSANSTSTQRDANTQLPSRASAPEIDCDVAPYALDFVEWIDTQDAFLIGVVDSVQPAENPVSVGNRVEDHRLENEEDLECQAFTRGLKVELRDVQTAGLPGADDITAVYIGFDYLTGWANPPHVEYDRVTWAEGAERLEPGMRLGLALRKEYGTERWGVSAVSPTPIFVVDKNTLHAQSGSAEYLVDICGGIPPLEKLDGANANDVIKEFGERAQSDAYKEARAKDRPTQDSKDGEIWGAGTWFSRCDTPYERHGDECKKSEDCAQDETCTQGFCVPL